MRTKCRHPQKEKARHAGRRQRPHADPLVGPGDPPCRDTARATTDQTRPCHCVVALATSSPGRRTTSAHQTKRATVVLGWLPAPDRRASPASLRGSSSGTCNFVHENEVFRGKMFCIANISGLGNPLLFPY